MVIGVRSSVVNAKVQGPGDGLNCATLGAEMSEFVRDKQRFFWDHLCTISMHRWACFLRTHSCPVLTTPYAPTASCLAPPNLFIPRPFLLTPWDQ